jgi:hypothetical protein
MMRQGFGDSGRRIYPNGHPGHVTVTVADTASDT